MKLTCTQENFKKAIYNSERIVSKQTTLPILNNILFEAEKGVLKLSATNLEIGSVIKIGAKIEKEGKLTIPAKLLSNFINSLPTADIISLEVAEQSLKIKSGGTKAVLKGLPATDFPLIPRKNTDFQIILPGASVKNLINRVVTAVAFNETRQELTGINLLLSEKSLFWASTDSFRLAEEKIEITGENVKKDLYEALISKKRSFIVPATTIVELGRIISTQESVDVKITIEEGQIFFEIDGLILVSRLINGKYPEYKHIMPKEFRSRGVFNKNMLQGAIKMASVFAPGKTSEVTVKMGQEGKRAIIEARSVEVGENVSELEIDATGPSQEIIFNSRYLLDGIGTITTTNLALLANDPVSPVALRAVDEKTGEVLSDYTYIVMPVKN